MNVLVVAPHPDDESIGCGGTICLHASRGDRVTAVFLTSGERGLSDVPEVEAARVREREAEEAARILGIASVRFLRRPDQHLREDIVKAAAALKAILQREKPKVIYLPHERDWHPDHRASVMIVDRALQSSGIAKPMLLCYEVQTPLTEYDRASDISRVIERKLRAIRAHKSQVSKLRYDVAARALNEYRGIVAEAGRYVEVFRIADSCLSGVELARRADPAWHRLYQVTRQITKLVPKEESFILVDEGFLEASHLVAPRQCIPFLEKNGQYWGKPSDDDEAIREFERLRRNGASFIIFAWPAFWWLDYYSGLRQYLRKEYPCMLENNRLVAFDLRRRRPPTLTNMNQKAAGVYR